jgi:hypothetical protein
MTCIQTRGGELKSKEKPSQIFALVLLGQNAHEKKDNIRHLGIVIVSSIARHKLPPFTLLSFSQVGFEIIGFKWIWPRELASMSTYERAIA